MRCYNYRQKIKPERPAPSGSRFMAMSKLIGLICLFVLLVIVGYTMYEMHRLEDLSNLSQLIICAFGLASIYVGFYITMAKMEHIEEERSRCKEELQKLRQEGNTEDIEFCKQEIASLQEQLGYVMQQETHSLL